MSKRDIHADITAQIIAALEAGTPPWRRPWGNGLGPSLPRNAVSGHRYRGVNALLLAWHPLSLASGDPRWCTYHQAQEKGWQVRKGEKGTAILFFKKIEIDDDGDDDSDAELSLPTELEQHASYIGGWLEALKHDKREIFRAAAVAQGIADWVLALIPQSEA